MDFNARQYLWEFIYIFQCDNLYTKTSKKKKTKEGPMEPKGKTSRHTLAVKSLLKPLSKLFLCICAWRSASWAIDMSMSPLLMCAVCLKFVGTPIMLRSILSLWCGLPLLRLLLLAACGVRQHVKHCTQSSLSPAIPNCETSSFPRVIRDHPLITCTISLRLNRKKIDRIDLFRIVPIDLTWFPRQRSRQSSASRQADSEDDRNFRLNPTAGTG